MFPRPIYRIILVLRPITALRILADAEDRRHCPRVLPSGLVDAMEPDPTVGAGLSQKESQVKVSFLIRVSNDRQDGGISTFAQLRAFGENPGREAQVVVREYVGEAETGRTLDRPK